MPPRKAKPKRVGPWAFVSARLPKAEKDHLAAAASAKGISLSRFMIESALSEAAKFMARFPSAKGFEGADGFPARRGPPGWEGQGRRFGLSYRKLLASRYDEALAKDKELWLREELASGDRFSVWIWLEKCFPAEARRIPEKKQILYLKGFMEALTRS